jgi:hypothetical protein
LAVPPHPDHSSIAQQTLNMFIKSINLRKGNVGEGLGENDYLHRSSEPMGFKIAGVNQILLAY